MSHIFIAHVVEDADAALSIALGLEEAGYPALGYKVTSVPGAADIQHNDDSLAQSEALVVIISPKSLDATQLTAAIQRAREGGKHIIPLLRGITPEELQQRQPAWHEAIGSAASVNLPQRDVTAVIPDIVNALQRRGVQPSGKTATSFLSKLGQALDELPGSLKPTRGTAPPVKWTTADTGRPKTPLIIALVSIIVALILLVIYFATKGDDNQSPQTSPTGPTAALVVNVE